MPTYLANTAIVDDLADLKSYKDYLNCTAYDPETLLVSLYTPSTSTELSEAQKNSLLFDYTLECVVRSEKYEAIPDLYRLDPS